MHRVQMYFLLLVFILTGCIPQHPNTATPVAIVPPLSEPMPTPNSAIPNFDHIAIVILENREFDSIIGSPDAPVINHLAEENTLLTEFYAVTHPSLPNYVALIGGDTYGYTETCINCPVTATNLADLIEARGLTWRSYQESMPSHCALKDINDNYVAKHNPFLYYASILNDEERCNKHVVDWEDFLEDVDESALPNFSFITPNICSDGHDCPLSTADAWLGELLPSLEESMQKSGDNYLIIVTWDEGETDKSCCGLPQNAGGRIATILISPQAQNGFEDSTPYSTYSLLRTISEAWGLPLLGHAADSATNLIIAPWK
jgi:phospholipase C